MSTFAERHVRLLEEVATRRTDDPAVQAERDAAREALEIGDHDAAVAHLQAGWEIVLAKPKKEGAALVAEEALVEESRLNYPEAALLFEKAASLLPGEDRDERHYLLARR